MSTSSDKGRDAGLWQLLQWKLNSNSVPLPNCILTLLTYFNNTVSVMAPMMYSFLDLISELLLFSYLQLDRDEVEAMRMARQLEEEKAQFSVNIQRFIYYSVSVLRG